MCALCKGEKKTVRGLGFAFRAVSGKPSAREQREAGTRRTRERDETRRDRLSLRNAEMEVLRALAMITRAKERKSWNKEKEGKKGRWRRYERSEKDSTLRPGSP